MANRVTITICGEEYTLVADESSAYMQKVGSYVSDKMTEVLEGAKVARTDAAVLTAVNLADELFKSQTAAEQLVGDEAEVTPPCRQHPDGNRADVRRRNDRRDHTADDKIHAADKQRQRADLAHGAAVVTDKHPPERGQVGGEIAAR